MIYNNVYLRYNVVILTALGFSSGLPLALTGSTLQAWLFSEGVDLKVLGFLSLVGLPYSLKLLWSPFLDYYSLPFLGRRRGWMLFSQLLLGVAVLMLSLMALKFHGKAFNGVTLLLVGIVCFMIAFVSATQDIVIDAYRVDILEPEERGAGSATTILGYRLAMLTSGALALIMSDYMSWSAVFSLMALAMFVCMIFTIVAKEPEHRRPLNLKEALFMPLKSYFSRGNAWKMLAFIVCFKMGDVIAAAMTTPMMLDLGFSRSDVGLVNKAFGLGSTIVGTFFGGALLARIGLNRSLWIFAILQALSNLTFAFLAMVGKDYVMLTVAVAIENLTGGMGSAGFVAFLISLCDRKYSATQYAFFSSLAVIARVMAGFPTGLLAERLGWILYYVFSVVGAVPAFLLMVYFVPWKER